MSTFFARDAFTLEPLVHEDYYTPFFPGSGEGVKTLPVSFAEAP